MENKDCFRVLIKDDEEYESMESFFITITPYRTTSNGTLQLWLDVVIQPSVAEVFITDDGM